MAEGLYPTLCLHAWLILRSLLFFVKHARLLVLLRLLHNPQRPLRPTCGPTPPPTVTLHHRLDVQVGLLLPRTIMTQLAGAAAKAIAAVVAASNGRVSISLVELYNHVAAKIV